MTVFWKYRSLKNMEYVLDILINNKMYLPRFHELNDPMEGSFVTLQNTHYDKNPENYKRITQEVIEYKNKYGVLSLSSESKNLLMWSHYADAGKGIAIGIIEKETRGHNVQYISEDVLLAPDDDPVNFARYALVHKRREWKHEKEYRILHEFYEDYGMPRPSQAENRFYKSFDIVEICLGPKISPENKNIISKITKKLLKNVSVYETEISNGEVTKLQANL